MYLDVYERDTSKYMHDTCTIHAGYMQDTWDTYRIGNYTKTYRKPHVTRGGGGWGRNGQRRSQTVKLSWFESQGALPALAF